MEILDRYITKAVGFVRENTIGEKDYSMEIDPIAKTVHVSLTQAEAFRLFTGGIDSWWPLVTHSVLGAQAESCSVESRAGGRIYETGPGGRQIVWGTVLAWEPYRRLVFSWHPGRDSDSAQEIEILFEAHEGGTRIELRHRGWEKLGDEAESYRRRYDTGWDTVLGECYRKAAERLQRQSKGVDRE